MQLFHSVIKNSSSNNSSVKVINTDYDTKLDAFHTEEDVKLCNYEEQKKSYEMLAETIMKNARISSEKMISDSSQKAVEIERKAYEKGYSQGKQNGYDDGYRDGVESAKRELEMYVSDQMGRALEILVNAEKDYKEYMEYKKGFIVRTILEVSKAIALREVKKDGWVVSMIEPLLEECKGQENLVIRCNEVHIDELNENIHRWKTRYSLKGEIFIINDLRMNEGNIIIEKDTGREEIGMDIAIKEIEKILEQETGVRND